MDLDKAFVSAVLREGKEAMRKAVEKGVHEGLLLGDAPKVWVFIREFAAQYNAFPTPAEVVGKLGYTVMDITAPADFYADELLNRRLHTQLGLHTRSILDHLDKRDPQGGYNAYASGLRELRKEVAVDQKSVSLLSLAPSFLEYYDKIKAGITGILTPWRSINDATLGFWPEDLILFVARMGIGKTWCLTLMAQHMWHVQKKRVLFASTEMSREKILQRYYAAHFKLPYEDFRRARLSPWAEERMRTGVKEIAGMEGLYIVGGDFDFRIESLEAAIDDCTPDIVLLDGAYLLRTEGDGRTEKAANSYDELKRLAKRVKLPVVTTTQLNRQAKGSSSAAVSADKIALSDAAGWNADLIYGMVQDDDMRTDGRMIFKPLKFREGIGEEVECFWNFNEMNFEEVAGGAPPAMAKPLSPEDDKYGTGLNFGGPDDGGSAPDVPF